MMHVSCAKNEPKLQEDGRLFLLCICTVITKEKCNCPKGECAVRTFSANELTCFLHKSQYLHANYFTVHENTGITWFLYLQSMHRVIYHAF